MKTFESVDAALNFAIQREAEAYSFYKQLADRSELAEMKEVFSSFANEEMGHKKKLQAIRDGHALVPAMARVSTLKLADYLVDVAPEPDLSMQDALIVAIKKEQKAYALYTDLADAAPTDELRRTFEMLAAEEAQHRLKFETLYDDHYQQEN